MLATEKNSRRHPDSWVAFAGLTCCVALLLGIVAIATAGSAAWLRGSLGAAGLLLLGVGGGLLVARLVLDERRSRDRGR
jgi:hypothetical protein